MKWSGPSFDFFIWPLAIGISHNDPGGAISVKGRTTPLLLLFYKKETEA